VTLGVGLIVALLFVIFEVGIRHVPPDGMTYTQYDVRDHWDASGHQLASTSTITSTTFTAANDQQVIDTYYHGLNDGERHDGPAGGAAAQP